MVTGTADSQGIKLDPVFVSATNFRLDGAAAANATCCIDKVTTPTNPNSGHDVDLVARPKGASWGHRRARSAVTQLRC